MKEKQTKDEKYSIDDFMYFFRKYNDIYDKKYTQGQIAQLIAKAMINFFEESETGY